MSHLEGLDPRALLLLRLVVGEPLAALCRSILQVIKLGVIPLPDHAAFLDRHRRLVLKGPINQSDKLGLLRDLSGKVGKKARTACGKQRLHGWKARERSAQRARIAGVPRSRRKSRHQALKVLDVLESFAQFGEQLAILRQLRHGVVALCNVGQTRQRSYQPVAQQPPAHRGTRRVQRPEQREAGSRTRFNQVQVPHRRLVEQHEVRGILPLNTAHMIDRSTQLLLHIMKDRARCTEPRRATFGAKAFQRVHLEMSLQQVVRGIDFKRPVVMPGHHRTLQAPDHLFVPARLFTRHDDFRRGIACEIAQRRGLIAGFLDPERARRKVEERNSEHIAFDNKSGEVVVQLRFERGLFEHRSRRDNPRDLTTNQPLHQGRILHLLADRNLAPGLHELRNIEIRGVMRHAAHRDCVPLRQREIKELRRFLGVVEEHLVEVAQPEEQQGVFRQIAANPAILVHHGRGSFRHGAQYGDCPVTSEAEMFHLL